MWCPVPDRSGAKEKWGRCSSPALRNPTGQVPGLPTEPGVSLGLVGGNVFLSQGIGEVLRGGSNFCLVFPK